MNQFISINEVSHTSHLEMFPMTEMGKLRQGATTSMSHINFWYRWRSNLTASSLGCSVYPDSNTEVLMLELTQKKCYAEFGIIFKADASPI